MDGAMAKATRLNAFLSGVSNNEAVKVQDREGTNFLAKLSAPDPEDRKWNMVSDKLMEKKNGDYTGKTIDGQYAIAPDSWYNYMSRKVDRQMLANYEGWAIDQVDLSKPESAEFWTRVLPWIREKREAFLEEQANIQKQLGLIKIRGVQSEEDMMLLFAVQNGLVSVLDKPLYDLDTATKYQYAKENISTNFTGGLLSPFSKLFITEKLKTTTDDDNAHIPVYDFKDPLKTPLNGFKVGAERKNYQLFQPK